MGPVNIFCISKKFPFFFTRTYLYAKKEWLAEVNLGVSSLFGLAFLVKGISIGLNLYLILADETFLLLLRTSCSTPVSESLVVFLKMYSQMYS